MTNPEDFTPEQTEINRLRRMVQTLKFVRSDGEDYPEDTDLPKPEAGQRYVLTSSDGVYIIEDRFDLANKVFLNTLDPIDLLQVVESLNVYSAAGQDGVILDLQQRIKDFETAAIEDETKIAGLEDDAQAYETQIKLLTQELSQLQKYFQARGTDITRIIAEKGALARENGELEVRLATMQGKLDLWESTLITAESDRNHYRRKLRKAKSIIKKLTKV